MRDEFVDWVAAITQIITPCEGGTPRIHAGDWQLPFKGDYFSKPGLSCFSYAHVGPAGAVILDHSCP